VALLDELRSFWRAESRDHRLALVVIVIAGLLLRLLTLSQPMRYDESITYLEFVRLPVSQALSHYDYPNNHLFHTLLAKASVAAFGNSPWAIRLPSFLAGIALIPLSYGMARTLYGARVAIISAALVASSGMLSMFATNARGYSIEAAAFVALVLVAARLLRAPSVSLWAAYAVTAAIGMWTIPVMLYPIGAVSLWLALNLLVERRRPELSWLAASLGGGALLTLLAYWPVFSHAGLAAVVGNKFVESTDWPQFLADLAVFGWSTLKSWGLGVPLLVTAALLAAAGFGVFRQGRHSTIRVGLPLGVFVWCAWLLVVTHRAPVPRMWMWCIPVFASLAGVGIVDALDRFPRLALAAARVPLIASFAAIVGVASVALSGAILRNRDTGAFVDAEETAAQIAPVLKQGDRVVAAIPTNGPLSYYLDRLGVDPAYMRLDEVDASRLIVVVNESEGESVDDVTTNSKQFVVTQLVNRPLSKVFLLERRDAPK